MIGPVVVADRAVAEVPLVERIELPRRAAVTLALKLTMPPEPAVAVTVTGMVDAFVDLTTIDDGR